MSFVHNKDGKPQLGSDLSVTQEETFIDLNIHSDFITLIILVFVY